MPPIRVIDSHTAGEPTRVVISGAPNLGGGTAGDQLEVFRSDHDHFRSAVINEPRGWDALVGALLVEPQDKLCAAGVIFFNNVGWLGMCGHGAIGVVKTLAHLRRIRPGKLSLETPVGVVIATLHVNGSVSVANVPSYRKSEAVQVNVPGIGSVTGDVAWGGNWFFLVESIGLPLEINNLDSLTEAAWRIRQAVNAEGFPEVDHVEIFGPPHSQGAHARNFVLCPGKAYDRSPCGTGTSAKLACLAADRKLREDDLWVQESVLGSRFTGSFCWLDRPAGVIVPTITGDAFITSEATFHFDDLDPFRHGIRPNMVPTNIRTS